MIENKLDYIRYCEQDRRALKIKSQRSIFSNNIMVLLTQPCYRFQQLLRKCEYYHNCKKNFLNKIYFLWLKKRFQRLSIRLGFTIPFNVFDEGLCILHYGNIVVSRHAKIGKNCIINSGVNIGISPYKTGAAKIGDNCYIGPGAKIFNDIVIGNNVKIGANAVVNKDCKENGVTLVGIPAKIREECSLN